MQFVGLLRFILQKNLARLLSHLTFLPLADMPDKHTHRNQFRDKTHYFRLQMRKLVFI